MFGMGMGEILIIAIIAILFLGPDKLPDAMVKIAKFFKTFKNSVNDVKSSFEQEMKIQELKEEALQYKKKLDEAATSARKVITFDELEEIKKSTQGVNDSLKEIERTIAAPMNSDRPMVQESVPTTTNTSNETPIEIKKEVNA
ncbi:MAG: Sec-independent protein translocase protein TatB [Sulfurospirillaceae bacterium]|nr:Sec-independent protein translocase protein TatB [Sulfurospirillaceae bacterium]